VDQGGDNLSEISEKEEDFVDRARNPKFNSRLACQCILQDDTDLVVTIPDQSGIIGH
jgi:2Fe-2S ferredoxin